MVGIKQHKPLVLIVDDTMMNIDLLADVLREEYRLGIATNGIKALEFVEKEKPDLVLLDIVLPNKDGWEILKEIKAKNKEIKVIILSNLGQKEEVEKGLKLGAEKYLIKSNFTPSEVVEEIKKLI